MPIPRNAGELLRELSRPPIYHFMRRRLRFVTGLDNIPRQGPLVLVANHSSYLDHFAMSALLNAVRPGDVWFPTKAESFKKFFSRTWHEAMRCYPVDRTSPGQQIFETSSHILANNGILVLYPEGTRGDGNDLLPFKTGAFRIALAAGATVVPVGTQGLSKILPKGVHSPQPGLYSMAVGTPISIPTIPDLREKSRAMRDDAVTQVAQLRQQADAYDNITITRSIEEVVSLAKTIIGENMSPEGTLDPQVTTRLDLLLGFAEATASHQEDLEIQRNRLRGFRAMNSRGINQLVKAIRTGRTAMAAANNYSRSDFAAYLAARASLALPKPLGGGPRRAADYFIEATKRGSGMTSQAYVGLAESRRAIQDHDGAIEAYRCALDNIDVNDPRGELRRKKVVEQLALLEMSDA